LDQSSIPDLKTLAEALARTLPEDHSPGDPAYLSRAALDICLAANWASDNLLGTAIDCARRYWMGQASEQARESVRSQVVERAEALRKQGQQFSPEWCKYALVMWSLDIRTPSTSHEADYLLDFSLKAGVSLKTIREALVAQVPGLSEALDAGSGGSKTA
jgi:hypothetical protein